MSTGRDQGKPRPLHREEDARRLLETSFDGIWAIDSDLRTTFVNARMAEMLGYSPEEMQGRPLFDFLFPEDVPAEEAAIRRRKRGVREELELRYRRKNGSELWVRVATAPILAKDGSFEGAVAIHSDITRRREADTAASHLAAIVEFSDEAIISKNLQGIITSWNAAAARLFGYSAEEAIGRSILMIIPPELHPDEHEILRRLRAGQRIEHFQTVRVNKNGERVDVSLTISPVRDSTGRIIGASKIARDISELKRAEQALVTSEKLATAGRLAATVAHEINNPLESVINLVYLARTAASEPAVEAYLAKAEQELNRIAQLSKQTLSFYRQRSEKTRAQAGELLRELVGAFTSRAQNRRVRIDLDIASDAAILVDVAEFRQLFANLISNGIDASDPGGCVRVRAAAFNHGLRVTVADNGSGIKPADRPHVFEPFFTTKKDVGTGLGLWICKQVADKYGGTIRVRSDARPGRSGTAVSVFLPVTVHPDNATPTPSPTATLKETA